MEIDELFQRIQNIERIQALADRPAPAIPNLEMSHEEQGRYIEFLLDIIRRQDREKADLQQQLKELSEKIDEIIRKLDEAQTGRAKLEQTIVDLRITIGEQKAHISSLEHDNSTLKSRLEITLQERFGSSKSQSKKYRKSKKDSAGPTDSGDDFDSSSNTSMQSGGSENAQPETGACSGEKSQSWYHGPSRKGWTYHKEESPDAVIHKSDKSKLPEGAVIVGKPREFRIRHAVFRIEEHVYELITYRTPDGELHEAYFPMEGEEGTDYIKQVVPGTHVTLDLLNFTVFQRYQLATPAYREARELYSELKWHPHRQNLLNWESKAASWLKKLIPALKNQALEQGADVNVDETWYRYQTHFGHEKVYVWCLVNRKAKIVIFFFENSKDKKGNVIKVGSRGEQVLKDFLSDAKIRSLQSDSCASYMYLDDELIDIEHLKCMAHVRAKFYYAWQQGSLEAKYMLDLIERLYKLEEDYRREHLDTEAIAARRKDVTTETIVNEMRLKLIELKAQLIQAPETISELLKTAITYLDNAWDGVFAYRNNGDYTIDNMAAERALRPLTNQRKGSLFFCSEQGAQNAAIFNTFIQTCRQTGISFVKYFRKVLAELISGREDYENLLPSTIKL